MRIITVIAAALATIAGTLAGCASTTPTREVSSGYAIFDIQAGPDIPAGESPRPSKSRCRRT